MTQRKCSACRRRNAATLPEWPALCERCLARTGQGIKPGKRVVCEASEDCSGTVDRLVDDGFLAVVITADKKEAWVPVAELIAAV